MIEYLILVAVSTLAGITWTGFGYLVDWRKNHNNPDWEGFNIAKLRNDFILGVVLGAAVSVRIIGGFFEMPVIDSPQTFIAAFPGLFTAIVAIDKFIIGGIIGREQT